MAWVLATVALSLGQVVPDGARVVWELRFDRPGDEQGLEFNGEIISRQATAEGLVMETSGSDPIIHLPEISIATSPYQALEITYECPQTAQGELFYAHDRNTEYGGFSGTKHIELGFRRTDGPATMTLWPFWLEGPELIQLRLDPPSDVRLVLHSVRILEVRMPDGVEWEESGVGPLWPLAGARLENGEIICTGGRVLLASPPIPLDSMGRPWLTVDWPEGAPAMTLEAGAAVRGLGGADWRPLELRAGESCNLWLPRLASAQETDAVVLIRTTDGIEPGQVLPLNTFTLNREPSGKPKPTVVFFGSRDAIARAGTEEAILLRIANINSAPLRRLTAYLERPQSLRVGPGGLRRDAGRVLVHGDVCDLVWPFRATEPGEHPVTVQLIGEGVDVSVESVLEVTSGPADLEPGRVPTPQPLETDYDIGVYYFPGWNSRSAWEVLDLFPERTPVLGYYREGMPEVVDWQILWAAEHGVRFFAYDWYWDRGTQSLDHGIKAYLRSQNRQYLDFCLLWANHNGAGSHSREDLLAVTRFWIDNYFREPGYYTVNGRPVVIIFNPGGIWNDMGGPEVVAEAFQEMRDLCEAEGVPPVYLVACSPPATSWYPMFKASGYDAVSAYNWPGLGTGGRQRSPFADLLEPHAQEWRRMAEGSGLPVMTPISAGWDSRPWHGAGALVLSDRTPEVFERHLRDAKAFMATQTGPLANVAIVEAWNEWGEGSYIEPHREYGFQYLDAIAHVFARDAGEGRVVLPKDVGLGPYEIPAVPLRTEWEMDGPEEGWVPNGGCAEVSWEGGRLSFVSTGSDPIIQGPPVRFAAAEFPVLRLTMSSDVDSFAQVFWRTPTEAISEANSYTVELIGDGVMREYVLPLSEKATWTGLIRGLRLDPVSHAGARIVIDSIRFATR